MTHGWLPNVVAVSTPPLFAQAIFPDPLTSLAERLGVAGILVLAATYLLRYFIAQQDKKDGRLDDITDRFIVSTREQTSAIRDFIAEQQRTQQTMASAIDKLTTAVDRLQERRSHLRDAHS